MAFTIAISIVDRGKNLMTNIVHANQYILYSSPGLGNVSNIFSRETETLLSGNFSQATFNFYLFKVLDAVKHTPVCLTWCYGQTVTSKGVQQLTTI